MQYEGLMQDLKPWSSAKWKQGTALNACKSWNIYRSSIFTPPLSFKIMQNEKQAEELGVTAEVTVIAS